MRISGTEVAASPRRVPCHFEPAEPRRGEARREIPRSRALIVLLLLITAPIFAAEEKWWESYNRGVKAVNAKNYDLAATALQKSIAQMPNESTAVRAGRNDIITYVPHFWLGIAKFNLGDVDGALQEWRTSEAQGAVAKTDYYPKLRDWVARAQTEKERMARSAAGDSKKAADAALARALSSQVEALTAGGDRTDSYRTANRKLQEALGIFNSAGSDIASYRRAEAMAGEARDLFAKSADEAKRLKSARAATPPRPAQPPPQQPRVVQVAPPQPPVQEAGKAPPTETVAIVTPPPVAPVTKKETTPLDATPIDKSEVAVARTVPAAKTTRVPPALASAVEPLEAKTPPLSRAAMRGQLESAYRAFASGNLDASEQALTAMLAASPSAEALLLRGCTRYTRAMLSRNPDTLLEPARQDLTAALKMNRALRLDKRLFSPKLVAFFDELRAAH